MYRSARFLPIIEANLDVLAAMPDVEILVSDRHGLDDTLERLRHRYEGDPRFRFFAATDGVDWVAHYNGLLARGRGTYFAWMPHDDTFPPGYYASLVEHLDARPDTLLAFGPLVAIDENGREPTWSVRFRSPAPWNVPERWRPADPYRMLMFDPWVPFRGVFRREPVARAGLSIHPTLCNEAADIGWVFGAALLGPVRFVPAPACTKRLYPGSTHRTTMPGTLRSQSSVYVVMARYAFRYSPSRRAAVIGLLRLAWVYVVVVLVHRVRTLAKVGIRYRAAKRWLAGLSGSRPPAPTIH